MDQNEVQAYLQRKRGGGTADQVPQSSVEEYIQRKRAGEGYQAPQIIQEFHPDIDYNDRRITKWYSKDPSTSLNYFQKKYQNMDFKLSGNDQILAKRKDEKDYRVVDPDTGFSPLSNPMEALRDIGDIGYDVASSIGTGIATAAGGLAGTAAGGVGALPAAAAAGAASSAGAEYLRQKLGKSAGLAQDVELTDTDVIASGLAGAAAPLMFGTGGSVVRAAAPKAAKGLIGKTAQTVIGKPLRAVGELTERPARALAGGLMRRGVGKLTEEGVEQAQRGLVGRLGSAAGGKIRGAMAGISGAPREAIEAVAKQDDLIDELGDIEGTGLLERIEDYGQKVKDRFTDVKQAKYKVFSDAVETLGDKERINVTGLKNELIDAIKETTRGKQTDFKMEKRQRLQGMLKEYFEHTVDEVIEVVDETGKTVKKKIKVRKPIERLSVSDAVELEGQLAEMAGYHTQNTARVSGSNIDAKSSKIDKEFKSIANRFKRQLSKELDIKMPENAIAARKEYGQIREMEKGIESMSQNPRAFFRNLRNSDIMSNMTNRQFMNRVDQRLGTDLAKEAQLYKGVEAFGTGEQTFFQTMSRFKSYPAGAIGAAAGAYTQRESGIGGSLEGAAAGGLLGAAIGSPWAMRKYLQGTIKAQALQKNLGPVAIGAEGKFIRSPWMGQEEEQ